MTEILKVTRDGKNSTGDFSWLVSLKLPEPWQCSSVQHQGCPCVIFYLLEMGGDKVSHGNWQSQSCALLSKFWNCNGRSQPFHQPQDKRVCAWMVHPLQSFQASSWLTPLMWYVTGVVSHYVVLLRLWPPCSTKHKSAKSWSGISSGYFPVLPCF